MMQKKTVAIIPARAGSKRCPQKNVALFKGKPMVAHTIEQALESKIFNEIIVTSDDPKVVEIARNYPVFIDDRDAPLATDNAPLIDLMRSLIKKYNFNDDSILCLLLVTGPLREVRDISNAFELFLATDKKDSVVSVTENENPVEMTWRIVDGRLFPLLPSENKTTRKQDFKKSLRYNDALIFDLAKNFMDPDRNLFGKSPVPYIMPPERSINIDYEFQLKIVQMMGKYYF
jgi:CMP-N-acetylneuraminic acid synthetase